MSERPRRRRSALEGKGYYIILLLCVAAIGISGFFLTRGLLAVRTGGFGQEEASAVSGQAQLGDQREAVRRQEALLSQKAKEAAEKAREANQAESAVPDQQPSTDTAAKEAVPPAPAEETAAYIWPVEGAVDRQFSLEVFAYDPTMGDWRTHDGLDIAAEPGTAVGACAVGTVESVTTDDMLGVMVTIDHGAGLKSIYANLDEAVSVEPEDPVEAGTVIGAVGTSAISESAGPSHLHFAMKEYGVAVDPLNYLH